MVLFCRWKYPHKSWYYCPPFWRNKKNKMATTAHQFDMIAARCRALFEKKLHDYGAAWRILRLSSLTDQIFIKAHRIRSIQQKGEQKVADTIEGEFIGIFNYSIVALIQLDLGVARQPDLDAVSALAAFDHQVTAAKELMMAKNHDYGEAWRDMRISSLTDLILQKLLRIKQIENNSGETWVSEGLDANYRDMINYAAFALIKLAD